MLPLNAFVDMITDAAVWVYQGDYPLLVGLSLETVSGQTPCARKYLSLASSCSFVRFRRAGFLSCSPSHGSGSISLGSSFPFAHGCSIMQPSVRVRSQRFR